MLAVGKTSDTIGGSFANAGGETSVAACKGGSGSADDGSGKLDRQRRSQWFYCRLFRESFGESWFRDQRRRRSATRRSAALALVAPAIPASELSAGPWKAWAAAQRAALPPSAVVEFAGGFAADRLFPGGGGTTMTRPQAPQRIFRPDSCESTSRTWPEGQIKRRIIQFSVFSFQFSVAEN